MNCILGGGIAGLIFAFYNHNFKILTPQKGGQFSSDFPLGARYMHVNQNNAKLLKDLNMNVPKKIIKVGYGEIANDNFFEVLKVDDNFRKNYYLKSRDEKSLSGFNETVMNSNHSEFECFDVDFGVLIETLTEAVKDRIIIEKVTEIDFVNDQVIINQKYLADKVVSTIPLPLLCRLTDLLKVFSSEFKSKDMSYYWFANKKNDYKQNFVYIGGDYPAHRITFYENGACCDVIGNKKFSKKQFGWTKKIKVPRNQIVESGWESHLVALLKAVFHIDCTGRYGSWDRKIKIEDNVKFALEYEKNE